MTQDAIIDITYTQSTITNTCDFPTLSVSAKLNADTGWPELVDSFVQFLRGTGFFINPEWVDEYKGHKKLSENAQAFIREYESHRDVTSEGEVGYHPIVSRGVNSDELIVIERPRAKKKKKKAKK